MGASVNDCQGPAPSGEFTGDRDVRDDRSLASRVNSLPAGMQPAVAFLPAVSDFHRCAFPVVEHGLAGPVPGAVMPRRVDQQPSRVGVASRTDGGCWPSGSSKKGGQKVGGVWSGKELDRRSLRRLSILRHAAEVSGSVAATCRSYGISRNVFYTWKRRYDQGGLDALRDRSSTPQRMPNATSTEVVGKIIHLRQQYHFGPNTILDTPH